MIHLQIIALDNATSTSIERDTLDGLVAAARDWVAHAAWGEADLVAGYYDDAGDPKGSLEFRLTGLTSAEADEFMASLRRTLDDAGHDLTDRDADQ